MGYADYEQQWQKMMYAFYLYQPTSNRKATQEDWAVRRLVWNFKDGKEEYTNYVAQLISKKVMEIYHDKQIVFVCIPASSKEKNEVRFKNFSSMVCQLTGAENGYEHVKVDGCRAAIHESHHDSYFASGERITLEKNFFMGKEVLLFDDVLTRGYSYAKFAARLESVGAHVLGGLFLSRSMKVN